MFGPVRHVALRSYGLIDIVMVVLDYVYRPVASAGALRNVPQH